MHEVSTDRGNWSPASSIDHLLAPAESAGRSDHFANSVPSPNAPPAIISHGSASGQPSITASTARPCLVFSGSTTSSLGQTTTTELRMQVGSGRIDRTDFVWKEGMPAWLAAQDIPELIGVAAFQIEAPSSLSARIRRRRSRSAHGVAFVFPHGTSLVGASILLRPAKKCVGLQPSSDFVNVAANAEPKADDADRAEGVSSDALTTTEGIDAERRLGECVGLVVTGIRATLEDGSVVEQAYGTGTCFVIDTEGHALTNKHVIETVQKTMRAKLLREKIQKELLMEIEPKVWASL